MHPPRFSLTVSILAFLCCLLILSWLLFTFPALKTAANDLYAQKSEHARLLLATFVNQLPETLPAYPDGILPTTSPAANYAVKLADEPALIRLTLLDSDGKALFSVGREGTGVFHPFAPVLQKQERSGVISADRSELTTFQQVVRDGVVTGTAGLTLSLATENTRLARSRQLYLAYFAIDFILLLGFGSFILSRIVVTPVSRLLAATERITRGQYGHQIGISGSSELAGLADSFNIMSRTLHLKDQEVRNHMDSLEKANSELRQAREEAIRTEKMASIGLLAAGMAHEIGTPLASVMGYAELLSADAAENQSIHDYARRISSDCDRIDRIVRGLLDYARPRSSTFVQCRVEGVVADTVRLLQQQGAFKGITVSHDADEGLPQVCLDPHQLQQVMINLLLNSRDAVADKMDGAVMVNCRSAGSAIKGQEVWIEVVDNGAGLSAAAISRVFDPFFTTKAPGQGTGLGLAISARIVEAFGGRILARNSERGGASFVVQLPAAVSTESET